LRIKKIFIFALFTVSVAADRPGNDRLWEGIYAFYNYEFNKSVSILSEVRERHPEHPTVHFTWAVSKWLRAQAYDGIEASYDTLSASLEKIIPVYDGYVEQYPEEPEYRLYAAAAKGLKARVHLGKKEWISVVREGIKGYSGIRAVHNENRELWDTYFPMGILNFYAGEMSGFVRFFAGLIGIEADKAVGIEHMTITADKGEFAWIEASQILVFVYLWMDQDFDNALTISQQLVERLPKSIYNQHLYTESLIRLNRLDDAEANLRLTTEMAEILPSLSIKGWLPTLKYQDALLSFYRGDTDRAIKMVTQSIDEFNTELDTPLGFGYLLRGKIHDMRGDRSLAVRDYRSAVRLDNYTAAMAEAREYLRRPFAPRVE